MDDHLKKELDRLSGHDHLREKAAEAMSSEALRKEIDKGWLQIALYRETEKRLAKRRIVVQRHPGRGKVMDKILPMIRVLAARQAEEQRSWKEELKRPARAKIKYTFKNDSRCVYATCGDSGDKIGPVWGHGVKSVWRALYTLTEECSCGRSKHIAPEDTDTGDPRAKAS